MKQGMVRDAATAKLAAEVNELLRSCERTLADHEDYACQGLYGDMLSPLPGGLIWDLCAVRARLEKVRDLVSGSA